MSVRSLAVSLRGTAVRALAAVLFVLLARPAGATVITASPVDFTAPEQSLFNGTVATFTDDDPAATPDSFVAIIDWGDGTSSSVGTITDSGGGSFVVTGQHTYDDEGTFAATVSIFDQEPGEGSASVTDTATITEADVLSGTPVTFPAPASVSFTTAVANFSDTLTSAVPGDFTATIDWGDATASAGTVSGGGGSFQVSGTHTYASPGNYPVVVTLSDDPPGTATAKVTSTAQVTAGLFVTAGDFSTPEAAAFNGPVATFADSDLSKTPADFTATIDWGDGASSAGTVSGGPGSFTVTGQHTYADEGAFGFTVTVTETGPGGLTDNSSATATVTEADALTGSPATINATAGLPFSGPVATFTDTNTANVAGDFTATIDWGDGTTTAGTVSGGGGTFTVSGTHTYASPGSFPVIVTLTDDPPGTATATVTSTANVAAAPVPVPALDLRGLLALGAALAAAALFRLRSRSGAA